jgi:sortase A
MAGTHLRRAIRTGVGVVLLWGTLGLAGYAYGWTTHRSTAAHQLVTAEHKAIGAIERSRRHARPGLCIATPARTGQLAGVLRIPALHLVAPVEEGTDDPQLAVSVGHDPWSVWPGQSGTAVLLAHDVSYFVHIDQLRPGDRIVYQTPCTTVTFAVSGSRVVTQGSPVQNTSDPTLVLDTCYPSNALFFTTSRLLVSAVESTRATAPRHLTDPASPTVPVAFDVPVPPILMAQGLSLEQNEAPMGTLSLVGNPELAWEQSPGPLNLEAAALTAYFGGLHAAAQRQSAWWQAIAPGVAMPPMLLGATVTGHDAPLDVEIDSAGGTPDAVVLRTTITLSGGASPGTYAESVTASVHEHTVTLGSWALTPA